MNNLFNLEYLNTFVTAAQTGRLNITAELVYRSHSAVSTQIKKLEEQTGNALFIRNKDTLTLTRHGEIILDYAKKMLELNDAAFQQLKNDSWKGNIAFGVPTDYCGLFAQRIYPLLRSSLPDIHFTTTCNRSRELRKQIAEGKLNAAIVAMEPQYSDDIFLWKEPLHWVQSRNFRHDPSEPLPVALFSDNCIINNNSLYCLKRANVNFRIVFASTMMDNIADAVRNGIGVSLLPQSQIDGQMVCIPQEYIPCPFTLNMGFTRDSNAEPHVLHTIIQCVSEGTEQVSFG